MSFLPIEGITLFIAGGYLGFVFANYFHWLELRHELFSHVSLLSAVLNKDSHELKAEPYPSYRVLENKALGLLYHGHDEAYEVCHAVANQIEELFRPIADYFRNHPDHHVDIAKQKSVWLNHVQEITPSWSALFWFNKRSGDVMTAYNSKENAYVAKRRADLKDKVVKDADDIPQA